MFLFRALIQGFYSLQDGFCLLDHSNADKAHKGYLLFRCGEARLGAKTVLIAQPDSIGPMFSGK